LSFSFLIFVVFSTGSVAGGTRFLHA